MECATCGLAACDLPDGVDPEFIFERIDGETYCQPHIPESPEEGRRPMARKRTAEPEFQHGMRFIDAQLPEGYTPPSASMDPNATVTPWPHTPADAEEATDG